MYSGSNYRSIKRYCVRKDTVFIELRHTSVWYVQTSVATTRTQISVF